MKTRPLSLFASAAVLLLGGCAQMGGPAAPTVADHLGLQMYSLRVMSMQQGYKAALDQTRAFGFRYVEGSAPPNVTAAQFQAELASRGLTMVGTGFAYEQLTKDIAGSVAKAKELGVQYAAIAWIPHQDSEPFTDDAARKAAADFNAWGAAFRAAGISLVYHPHGYEFRPNPDGSTAFDALVHATNPDDVNFEIDVFWATHGGQDAAKLMARYPDRWRMMHVKDLRKGAPTGIYTGHAPATDDVPVGQGQVDWPAVFREAKKDGVQWYFIEDESTTPLTNIPLSVAYVKSLGL